MQLTPEQEILYQESRQRVIDAFERADNDMSPMPEPLPAPGSKKYNHLLRMGKCYHDF